MSIISQVAILTPKAIAIRFSLVFRILAGPTTTINYFLGSSVREFSFPTQQKILSWSFVNYSQYAILVVFSVLASGCLVGPDFSPPKSPGLISSFSNNPETIDTSPLENWLVTWADPKLVNLITLANAGNLDIRRAYFRIREAGSVARVVRGGLAPTGDLISEYSFRQQSENAEPFAADNSDAFDLFSKGFNSAWQIDLFGQIRRSIEAAEADVSFNEFEADFIRRTLLTEVAGSYVQIRLFQDQIRLVRQSLQVQEMTGKLVSGREKAGVSTELDKAQTDGFIERTRTLLASLEQQLDVQTNRLAVLTGQVPSVQFRENLDDQATIDFPTVPDIGFPANLLRNRPDVRREEMAFARTLAEIGVAEADLYPQLTLIGNVSVSAQNLSDLFTSDALAFVTGPSLRWNIIQFGRIRNNIEAARARTEQAQLAYQQTVLGAVREVEDGIINYNGLRRQTTILSRAVAADQKAVELSLQRYKAGRANFQRVLDSQRQLQQDSQQRSLAFHQAIVQLVTLYTSLGGSWDCYGTQVCDFEMYSTIQSTAASSDGEQMDLETKKSSKTAPDPNNKKPIGFSIWEFTTGKSKRLLNQPAASSAKRKTPAAYPL